MLHQRREGSKETSSGVSVGGRHVSGSEGERSRGLVVVQGCAGLRDTHTGTCDHRDWDMWLGVISRSVFLIFLL